MILSFNNNGLAWLGPLPPMQAHTEPSPRVRLILYLVRDQLRPVNAWASNGRFLTNDSINAQPQLRSP